MGDDEVAGYEKQKNTLQSEIDSLIEVGRQALIKKTYAGIPAVLHDDLLAAQKIAKEKRSEVQKYLTEKFGETFNFNQAQVMPTLARETQLEVTRLTNEINAINSTGSILRNFGSFISITNGLPRPKHLTSISSLPIP